MVDDPRSVLGALAAQVYGHPDERLLAVRRHRHQRQDDDGLPADAGLRAAGRVTGLVGTVETRVGDEVLPSVRTTPEAPDLQALLAVDASSGV